MRVQQLVIGRLDAILKPHGLTFARYEALVLLVFSSRGSLPLGKMGERLQVHPTSVTSIVQRLEAVGLRRPPPAPRGRPGGARRDHRRRAGPSSRPPPQDLLDADFAPRRPRPRPARGDLRAADPDPPRRRRLLSRAMVTADDVRRVALALPRSYEVEVRGRWKFRVKQIVYVAFSRDELDDGLRLPQGRARRADRVRPRDVLPAADLRPALPVGVRPPRPARPRTRCASWSSTPGGCARRRCCTSSRSSRAPTAAAWAAMDAGEWGELRPLLHPYLHWTDGDVAPARPQQRARAPPGRTRPRSRRARSRSATARSTAGHAEELRSWRI